VLLGGGVRVLRALLAAGAGQGSFSTRGVGSPPVICGDHRRITGDHE
jgi:hypothetical protein